MSESVVAKRYAEALFQLTNEKQISEQLVSEFNIVKEVFQQDEKLLNFLNHPRVALKDKLNVIDESFKSCDQIVLNTLKLLVERHRLNEIVAIVNYFVHLHNEENGIATATVYSVRPLSAEEKAALGNKFKQQLNKQQLIINNEIDPSILGGVKIRIGNTIYDGSISGKLNRMKQNLISANL